MTLALTVRRPAPTSPRPPAGWAAVEDLAAVAARHRAVAWFGQDTGTWWAMVGGRLFESPTAGELAGVIPAAAAGVL